MDRVPIGWTLSELAEIVGGELHGPANLRIKRPVPAGENDPEGITFAESQKYLDEAEGSEVGAVIVNTDEDNCTKPHIRCRSPREAFGRLLALSWQELPAAEGVHPTAVVSQDAEIEPGVSIGPFCVIEGGTKVCAGVKIFPFCYVGEECRLGTGARLYPHVTLYRDVWIGERTIVHSGAVLGADGFGYFWDGARHRKVPQVGGVRVGDDCEIGALSAIDRATAGETRIGDGTKIDNLVQLAHNVDVGAHTVIASQSGVAGSSKVGSRVTLGGQVGIRDHVSITDDVSLGARSGVARDINEPGDYWGAPSREVREEVRIQLLIARLPKLVERIEKLEQRLEQLGAKEDDK